jgi:hypothetical protein
MTHIQDSNQLVEIVEEMHSDFNRFDNAELKQLILEHVKNLCRSYYKAGKEHVEKNGKRNSLYDETCIWGHIHNLNKPKALRALNKYKKEMTNIIDGMLFDGKQNTITRMDIQKNTTHKLSNEEGFRQSCESIKNYTHAFELLIELI